MNVSSWTTKNFMLSLADCESSDHTGYSLSLYLSICIKAVDGAM